MAQIYLPKPIDLITPYLNLQKLRQGDESLDIQKKGQELQAQQIKSLNDYRQEQGAREKFQNVIGLINAGQESTAEQIFNNDPELVKRVGGPIKFSPKEQIIRSQNGLIARYQRDPTGKNPPSFEVLHDPTKTLGPADQLRADAIDNLDKGVLDPRFNSPDEQRDYALYGAQGKKSSEPKSSDAIQAATAEKMFPGDLPAQQRWIQQQKTSLIGAEAGARESVNQRQRPPKIPAGGGIVDKDSGQIYDPTAFTQEEFNAGKDKYKVLDKAQREQVGYIESMALPAVQQLKELVPKLAVKAGGQNLINYVQKEIAKGVGADPDVQQYVQLKTLLATEEARVVTGGSRVVQGMFTKLESETTPNLKQTQEVQNRVLNTSAWTFDNRLRGLKGQKPQTFDQWQKSQTTNAPAAPAAPGTQRLRFDAQGNPVQ